MSRLGVFEVSVRYGAIPALSKASFVLNEGERLFISGPNGAGKSSLLKAIAGVVPTAHGRIEVDGESMAGKAPEAIAAHGLSMVPEGREIFGNLTVEENLRVGLGLREDRTAIAGDLNDIYALFPILGERRHSNAGMLSGGQQQMLAISRAIMTNPKLILIDEPSLGLAPNVVDQVYDALIRLQKERGLTLLIVEQSSSRAARVGGKMIILRGGRIVSQGDASEFAEQDLLKEAYFGNDGAEVSA